MPIVYFVRHGETDWNAERRIQGQTDIPLNDKGRGQAARNGQTIAGIHGAPSNLYFVSSPLIRAAETMQIIRAALGLPREGYATDRRLMEIHFGDGQGQIWDEVRDADTPAAHARKSDPWNAPCPGEGGESNAMLSRRTVEWFAEVERDTVVVSHGGVMRALRAHILGLDAHEMIKLPVPQDQVLRIDGAVLTWH